jgi:predicted transposase/invertase (TIGR01784 family)
VVELLRWREPKIARRIEFDKLTVLPETFVTPDFAALESDVLLRVPFRLKIGADGMIQVFILIEHQSEPDALMIFRVIRYVMMIYEHQATDWRKTHHNLRGFEFDPVWPIVFYSGTRTWTQLKPMRELVRGGNLFEKRLRVLEPEFINLATTSEEELQRKIGWLGWVLWLNQQRKRKSVVLRDVRSRVVEHLDGLVDQSNARWEYLLQYAHELIYPIRERDERQQMAEFIPEKVRKSKRAEVEAMGKSIAEALKDEGFLEGRQEGVLEFKREDLLRALRVKFKRVPAAIQAEINATQDIKRLEDWLDEVVTATALADVHFSSQS